MGNGEVVMIGPIRQEVLSGIRRETQFETLRTYLEDFRDTDLIQDDFERAARFFNHCQARGISGTAIDLLICAVGSRLGVSIFTTDTDFFRFTKVLPIRLHEPERA